MEEKQTEFDASLQDLQKNVDKITRELGETKEQGQWYYKKKKRNDKMADLKEMIYICDLVRQLPKAYLIGVWEIIHEQPFREQRDFKLEEIDISTLKTRKIREVEYYVKYVLSLQKKSKAKKRVKIEKLIAKEEEKLNEVDQQVVATEANEGEVPRMDEEKEVSQGDHKENKEDTDKKEWADPGDFLIEQEKINLVDLKDLKDAIMETTNLTEEEMGKMREAK